MLSLQHAAQELGHARPGTCRSSVQRTQYQHPRIASHAAHSRATTERLLKPSAVTVPLQQARQLLSPTSLTIPQTAVTTLFQQRTTARASTVRSPRLAPRVGSSSTAQVQTTQQQRSTRSAAGIPPSNIQVVLTYEVDGTMVPDRSSLVDLRFHPNRRSVRISNHRAYDLLEGKMLTGWRRDEEGRLVAILKTRDGSSSRVSGATPASTVSLAASTVPNVSAASPAGDQQTISTSHVVPAPSSNTQGGKTRPASKKGVSFITQVQQSVQQQLASSAAILSAAVKHTLHRTVTDEERQRTYVPARVRPVMNEVYIPFGMWRDLFDGSSRPFPSEGMPIRVMITGAVNMSEQPALMVRRITPYGYYVLRGVKGLSRLKGKLMVRWSLLLNGVVEMEVSDKLPAAARLHPMSNPAAFTDPANN